MHIIIAVGRKLLSVFYSQKRHALWPQLGVELPSCSGKALTTNIVIKVIED